jgi:hypothetical protein
MGEKKVSLEPTEKRLQRAVLELENFGWDKDYKPIDGVGKDEVIKYSALFPNLPPNFLPGFCCVPPSWKL